ncbi:MAG: hypothetical protein ACLPV4_06260, partial [Solirubrobacteraceae bacterium]
AWRARTVRGPRRHRALKAVYVCGQLSSGSPAERSGGCDDLYRAGRAMRLATIAARVPLMASTFLV